MLALDGEETVEPGNTYRFRHPLADYRYFSHTVDGESRALLKKRLEHGEPCGPLASLEEIRAHVSAELECFDSTYKRLLNPHVYKVSVTEKLRNLKLELINRHFG